jgi:hypothetical protein
MWIILGIIFYWKIVTALEYRKDDDDMVANYSIIFVAMVTAATFVLVNGSGQDGITRIFNHVCEYPIIKEDH